MRLRIDSLAPNRISRRASGWVISCAQGTKSWACAAACALLILSQAVSGFGGTVLSGTDLKLYNDAMTAATIVGDGTDGDLTVGDTLTVNGSATLGDADADTITVEGTTVHNAPLRMPNTGGPSPWNAQPLVFGDENTSGNGSPIFIDADDYAPDGFTRCFVLNHWSDTADTYLLQENTSVTYSTHFLLEDCVGFGYSSVTGNSYFRLSDIPVAPNTIAQFNHNGWRDFVFFSDDNWLDLYCDSGGGLRIGQETGAAAPDLDAMGTLWSGRETCSSTPTENPSGLLVLRGIGTHIGSGYTNLGGRIQIHGQGAQPDWLIQAYGDALTVFAAPANMEFPQAAEAILDLDYNAGTWNVNVNSALAVDGNATLGDAVTDAHIVNGGVTLNLNASSSMTFTGGTDLATITPGSGDGLKLAGTTYIGGNLYPDADGTRYLGWSTLRWMLNATTGDFSGDVILGDASTDQATVNGDLACVQTLWRDMNVADCGLMTGSWGTGGTDSCLEMTDASLDHSILFPVHLYEDSIITRLRVRIRCSDLTFDAATFDLLRQDATATTGSWTVIATGSPLPGSSATWTTVTLDIADYTVTANQTLALRITLVPNDVTTVRVASVGFETSRREY